MLRRIPRLLLCSSILAGLPLIETHAQTPDTTPAAPTPLKAPPAAPAPQAHAPARQSTIHIVGRTPHEAEQVIVTAHLDQQRMALSPSTGATVHTFSRKALETIPGGDNAPLNQVLLQAPGVAQDSYGQIHVRGDHNEVQYRLDGVQLPEGAERIRAGAHDPLCRSHVPHDRGAAKPVRFSAGWRGGYYHQEWHHQPGR
jgi:hypothetical protein